MAGTVAPLAKVVTPQGFAICMDKTEVTKGQYAAWLDTSPSTANQPPECSFNQDFTPADATWPPLASDRKLPVVGVDWCDARAYCLGVDKRLCGRIAGGPVPVDSFADIWESEWYDACTAQGTQSYPYGQSYDPGACNGLDQGSNEAAEVGSYPECVTSAGVYDLSGNVAEWEDCCSGAVGSGDECHIRGGAWNSFAADQLACASDLQYPRGSGNPAIGFRCCADASP